MQQEDLLNKDILKISFLICEIREDFSTIKKQL